MLEAPLKWLISAFFAGAMLALVVGLTVFLREVHLGMQTAGSVVRKDQLGHTPEPDRIATAP